MENNTEMQQLLERLEKSSKQQAVYSRLQFYFSVVAVVLCLVLVATILLVTPQVRDLANRADTLLANLETVTDQLAELDLSAMISNVDSLVSNVDSLVTNADSLVSSSQEGVAEALLAIEAIDIETLNKAIADFSAVVEPLAEFFHIFDR